MKERVVNVFVYGDLEHIHSIGWHTYMAEGSYQELTSFLQSRVEHDFRTAHRLQLPKQELRSVFEFALRLDNLASVVPEVPRVIGDSVYVITHIVNGAPLIGDVRHAPPYEIVPDYLTRYWTDSGFDFVEMFNEDFMDAIRVVWNDKKYISALKLLFIFLDTLGFAEYGPTDRALIKWLDEYCDLSPLGVSSLEIWELRNSLIHMTNLDSRKVRTGAVTRLMPLITHPANEIQVEGDDYRSLHLSRFLLSVIPMGLVNWAQTFSGNRDKWLEFIRRYDTVVSDTRLGIALMPDEESDDHEVTTN